MTRAFNEWTPVDISVDDNRAKPACIEVPTELTGRATLGPAVIVRHNNTGLRTLAGISAAPRSPGESVQYAEAACPQSALRQ